MPSDISKSGSSTIKLDDGGLALIPQPTNSPSDPLNYPNVCTFYERVPPLYGSYISLSG